MSDISTQQSEEPGRVFTYHSYHERKLVQSKTPRFSFGLDKAVPLDTDAAWGQRAVCDPRRIRYERHHGRREKQVVDPAKLHIDTALHNRSPGFCYITEEAKQKLQELLNNGILQKVKDDYVELSRNIHGNESRQHVLYEDDQVKVVGDTRASGGYLYVAAWLKPQEVQQ